MTLIRVDSENRFTVWCDAEGHNQPRYAGPPCQNPVIRCLAAPL